MQAYYIKSAIQPVDFYRFELQHESFKQSEWNEAGKCPFHEDRKPGSFHVNIVTGGFNCFSCGARGGGFIDFTMQRYQLSFKDAMHKLARDWGL